MISEADAKARTVSYHRDRGWSQPEVDGPPPDGLVSWAPEETVELQAGWVWWIDGSFGSALTYEAARAAVERKIARRVRP